ncbi:MAG: hypothetical protein BAJALOKI1v1_1880003 [Promethearchaeota archaeon]|nr:MAG: hypothetical protein BAJALOKI1v1_1880003 [Candidatus Lokiarchaeota archaeon]
MVDKEYWERTYEKKELSRIPWHSDDPPIRLKELIEKGDVKVGKALDLCSGAGTNSIFLAKKGFDVIGIDISEEAVKIAKERAKEDNVAEKCQFLSANVLEKEFPPTTFNFIIDRGCYHHMPQEEKPFLAQKVEESLKPMGMYLLYCFSDQNRGWEKGVPKSEIYDNFGNLLEIREIKEVVWEEPPGNIVYMYAVVMVKKG